jgi:hypothetical protein
MASDRAIQSVVAAFAGAYPITNRDPVDVKAARLLQYKRSFADLTDGELDAAVQQIINERTSDYPPSPGAVRECAMRLREMATGEEEVDEYEAWSLVSLAARSALGFASAPDERRAWFVGRAGEHKGEVVYRAAERLGWRDICLGDSDDEPIRRAQFRDLVKAMQRRDREARRMSPVVREAIAQIASRMDVNAAGRRQVGGAAQASQASQAASESKLEATS